MIETVMFKDYIQKKLEKYVRTYLQVHGEIKVVIVTGSVGKTATKLAIGTILSERYRVRLHEGNHNATLSAPLAILGIEYPEDIRSMKAWRAVFRAAKERIKQPSDVDVIIQEIGSDRIGQVPQVATYLRPTIAVITAVSPEHMEYFGSIEAVAMEELSAANFSEIAIINRDDIDGRYASLLTNANITTYGSGPTAEYYFSIDDFEVQKGYKGHFIAKDWEEPVSATINVLGEHSIRPATAAATVGLKLGLNSSEISKGLSKIHSVPGRMSTLRGFDKSIVIDDTYNSSPLAASTALKTLYSLSVPQRIAVLGSMNELGTMSAVEHDALGRLCDPNELAWVITVGDEAEKYLAPAARARGCQVRSFKSAIAAGGFARQVMEEGAAILFKGSEKDIYLEEGVKIVLHSTDDEAHLVRQSTSWIERKNNFFSSVQ